MDNNEFLLDILTQIHKVTPRPCPVQYLASVYWDPAIETWQDSYVKMQEALRNLYNRGCLKNQVEKLTPNGNYYYIITTILTDAGLAAAKEKKLPKILKLPEF